MTQPILKFVIIGPDTEMAARLGEKLRRLADISIVVKQCATLQDGIVSILRGETGLDEGLVDTAFVQLSALTDADRLIDPIIRTFPGLPVLGLTDIFSSEIALAATLAGAQEMVALDITTHPALRKMIGSAVHEKRWTYRLALMAEHQSAMRAVSRYQFKSRFQTARHDERFDSLLVMSLSEPASRLNTHTPGGMLAYDWRDVVGHVLSDHLSEGIVFCKLSRDAVGWLVPRASDDAQWQRDVSLYSDILQTHFQTGQGDSAGRTAFAWARTSIPHNLADFDEALKDGLKALQVSREQNGKLISYCHPTAERPDLDAGQDTAETPLRIYFRQHANPTCEVAHIAPSIGKPSDHVHDDG